MCVLQPGDFVGIYSCSFHRVAGVEAVAFVVFEERREYEEEMPVLFSDKSLNQRLFIPT